MSVAAPPTPCSPQGSLGIWSLGRRRLHGPLLDSAGHVGPHACPEGAGAVVRRERRVRVMDRSPGSEGFLQEAPAGLPRRVWCRAHGASLAQGQTTAAPPAQVINRSSTELPLTVSYDKISLGRLRFWIHMQDAVYSLQQFGEAAGRAPGAGSRGAQNSVPVRL